MASIFEPSSSPPPVSTPAPLPQRSDAAVSVAARQSKLAASRRRGRRATRLTSGQGVTETATVGRPEGKTVLG